MLKDKFRPIKNFIPDNARRASTFLSKGMELLNMDKIIEKEPMAMFGFGIVSYMQLLQFMSLVFIGLSII